MAQNISLFGCGGLTGACRLWRAGASFGPAANPETTVEREQLWQHRGIPYREIASAGAWADPGLGRPVCTGGFEVPDAVLDFLRLLDTLVERLPRLGARRVLGAEVMRIVREGDAARSLLYPHEGCERAFSFDHLVVCAGSWARGLLQEIEVRPAGAELHVAYRHARMRARPGHHGLARWKPADPSAESGRIADRGHAPDRGGGRRPHGLGGVDRRPNGRFHAYYRKQSNRTVAAKPQNYQQRITR